MFHFDKEIHWQDLGDGVSRKILSYNDELMMVRVRFKKGAIGVLHQHFHTQSTFVLKGKFDFRIGDEHHLLETGDTCLMSSQVVHGCTCLEAGELLDVFNPFREDFLSV